MSLVYDVLKEIDQQARQCEHSGDAVREWEDAREISASEVLSIVRDKLDTTPDVISLEAGILLGFRWGYEVAIIRERQNIL